MLQTQLQPIDCLLSMLGFLICITDYFQMDSKIFVRFGGKNDFSIALSFDSTKCFQKGLATILLSHWLLAIILVLFSLSSIKRNEIV